MSKKLLKILIADDDPEDLEIIEEAILNLESDAKLHKVTNGKAVIEYLNDQLDNELPALIILDYNMPELNGLQVLTQIGYELRYKSIPKVVLSTSGSPKHVHECIGKGAAEYCVKPNNMAELKSLAKKMVAFCKGG